MSTTDWGQIDCIVYVFFVLFYFFMKMRKKQNIPIHIILSPVTVVALQWFEEFKSTIQFPVSTPIFLELNGSVKLDEKMFAHFLFWYLCLIPCGGLISCQVFLFLITYPSVFYLCSIVSTFCLNWSQHLSPADCQIVFPHIRALQGSIVGFFWKETIIFLAPLCLLCFRYLCLSMKC